MRAATRSSGFVVAALCLPSPLLVPSIIMAQVLVNTTWSGGPLVDVIDNATRNQPELSA